MPLLPTFPARPMNGGPLDKALPKSGLWAYEPKVNGWRTLVHGPTGRMWNRRGEPLTVAAEFAAALLKLKALPFEWFDCEGLERRHCLARGSLIVLDLPLQPGTYSQRRQVMGQFLREILTDPRLLADHSIGILPNFIDDSSSRILETWTALQRLNRDAVCEFYEGLVAKRADSPYPLQLRNPKAETPHWVKHRWHF